MVEGSWAAVGGWCLRVIRVDLAARPSAEKGGPIRTVNVNELLKQMVIGWHKRLPAVA